MCSEQMRAELESFVNKGLKEGWRGWPLKSQTPCLIHPLSSILHRLTRDEARGTRDVPATAGFFGSVQQITLREISHFNPTILKRQ